MKTNVILTQIQQNKSCLIIDKINCVNRYCGLRDSTN